MVVAGAMRMAATGSVVLRRSEVSRSFCCRVRGIHFGEIKAGLNLNQVGRVLLRIEDRNHDDRIGLLDRSASSGRGIFAAERPFDLPVYF
jgi:hypothetical protein